MCNPVAVAGLMAATTAISVKGQYDSAKAQQSALDLQAQQQAEENAAARDEEIGERMRAARVAAARRLVAAGEAGVAGQSMSLGIFSEFGSANQDAAKISKQAAFEQRANYNSYRAALSQISKPNGLSAGLQIAGAAVSGYAQGKAMASRKGP